MPRRKTISLEDKQKIVKLNLEQYGMINIGKIMDFNIQTVSRIVHQYLRMVKYEIIQKVKEALIQKD